MSVLEPPSSHEPGFLAGLRLSGDGWSVSDWVVGMTSVVLAVASAGFFATSYVISIRSPGYFQEAALANLPPRLDPTITGSLPALADALPAQTIRRGDLKASDYQIVMVFGGEALLATGNELLRARVGTVLPGIGRISAVEPNASGGTVVGDLAVLRAVAPAQGER